MIPYGCRKDKIRIGLLSKSGCDNYGSIASLNWPCIKRHTATKLRIRRIARKRIRRIIRESINNFLKFEHINEKT